MFNSYEDIFRYDLVVDALVVIILKEIIFFFNVEST
jgi:hypothetical protein